MITKACRAALPLAIAIAALTQARADEPGMRAHREDYIVRFTEAGLLHYRGGISGLNAPARSTRKLDVHDADAVAYRAYLQDRRAQHLAEIAGTLGRVPDSRHSYAITMNGMAIALTGTEAERLRRLPGVASVHAAGIERLHTYRGPGFIGAGSIWNGSATPLQLGTRGQGVVIGIIDSGAYSAHPAFADDAACGHGTQNPKLLGAFDCSISDGGFCSGPDPEANPGNGHGVHVAGTAAGNVLDASANPPPLIPAPYSDISGVAPCAQVRSYKVCQTNSCDGAAILAAVEHAIADGVDIINYSISGGQSPWTDVDRSFLEAVAADIFVAASAGNTGAVTNPVGQVNHLGPWVMSVAAVSHDKNAVGMGTLQVNGPGTPPAALNTLSLRPGSGVNTGSALAGVPLRRDPANPLGCAPFAPGHFDGAIALMARGDCAFEQKINHAQAAGASVAIIYNNQADEFFMVVGAASLPAYSITQANGQALASFIDASVPQQAKVNFAPAAQRPDTLASFSLRGPTGGMHANLAKPDIAAPGISIYAPMDTVSGEYAYLSGTSMASPHVAGAAALLRAVHPGWTPMEIKSALQTTAMQHGYDDDAVSAWNFDDVGSGRVDLHKAALAGLVLDETYDHFLAANPTAGALPLTELNVPSLRNVTCTPSCTFTRTLTNRLATTGSWLADYEAIAGNLQVEFSPPSFTLAPGQSQTLTVTVAPPYGTVMNALGFGRIWLNEIQGKSPSQHLSLTAKGTGSFTFVDIQSAGVAVSDMCDSGAGSGNGIAEPGERVRVSVPLRARGGNFGEVTAQLGLPAPAGVTYIDSSYDIGSVALGATVRAEFLIEIDVTQSCLSTITLPLMVTSDHGSFRTDLPLSIGQASFEPADVPLSIPDNHPAGAISQLTIAQDIAIEALRVRLAVQHGWVGDLSVRLRSPAGTEIALMDRPGHPAQGQFGCGNRDVDVVFDDAAVVAAEGTCATALNAPWPATSARPDNGLSAFAGESTQGIWTLTVVDQLEGFSGRIASWSLLPEPAFEPICTVCGERPALIFADGFDGDSR